MDGPSSDYGIPKLGAAQGVLNAVAIPASWHTASAAVGSETDDGG